MKTLKLWVHQNKLSDKQGRKQADAILINPKEFPQVTVGDVVEIYHPEEEFSRLLLQIQTLSDEFQHKDIVSIETSIANAFQLKTYQNVIVNKVDKKAVTVDLVEVLFKEQYFSRSDMHRMRNSMIGSCVYLKKKIEFSEMWTQVNELWAKGEKVACGVVSQDTRIVFRSSTAVVQIFIQMSSEMWDFDNNGDLYFEKAVNGFLTDLYAKWKEQSCCHDVTIVMFSRTFYEAQSWDEFPSYMRECLQQDHMGRFYEDFYRIVVQNERYDEWTGTLKQLRRIFHEYLQRVLTYHVRPGATHKIPRAYNSTAAQGNFLETLNMTLNLFETYYLDRNFDRTGKVAVVITPGAGVFEVDRELTNITKQRTIDCGVGSDLVCMGEQPLHAAPLFKFHSRNVRNMLEVGDDYNIPHWMNHSFYTSKNQIQFFSNKNFVPRIKIPPDVLDKKKPSKEPVIEQDLSYTSDDDNFPFVDYDEYDNQVFKQPNRSFPTPRYGMWDVRSRRERQEARRAPQHPATFLEAKLLHMPRTRHISDDVSLLPAHTTERGTLLEHTAPLSIPSRSSSGDDLSSSLGCYPISEKSTVSKELSDVEGDVYAGQRQVVGSAGSPVGHRRLLNNYHRHRALINPFAPSRMQFKMTSNRRRWVHAFPTDPHGAAVQTHHVHTYSYHDNSTADNTDVCEPTPEVIQAANLAVQARKERGVSRPSEPPTDRDSEEVASMKGLSPSHRGAHDNSRVSLKTQRSFLWGPTGEQEWSPELITGQDWRPLDDAELSRAESRLIKPILTADFENTQNFCAGISVDWKSLIMPASLPITTDYLPEESSLQNDYVVADYDLLPDDVNGDYYMFPPLTEDEKYYRKQPLTTKQVFKEQISQRLAQGFQLIVQSKVKESPEHGAVPSHVMAGWPLPGTSPKLGPDAGSLMRARPRTEEKEEVYLSIGRIFHRLTLAGPNITVTRYRPRHPNPQMCKSYRYRFQAPDSYSYDVSWSEFRNEKLENYNWNYLDQYICTRGEGDYGLMESLKFWRSRFFILPCNNPATRKIIDGHPRCDIYEEKSVSELRQLVSGFTRYTEILNKMKRTAITRHMSCKDALSGRDITSGKLHMADKHTEWLAKNPGGIPVPDTRPAEEVLCLESPSEKIVEWMLDQECGIPMLPKQRGLPEQCFISAEVVDWCYYHVKGVQGVHDAMAMLQRMLCEGYLIHASGNPQHRMVYGFYLYRFVTRDKQKAHTGGVGVNPLFQNDWCEVTVLPPVDTIGPDTTVKFSLDTEASPSPGHINSGDLTADWRVQTGLAQTGQTWAQQSATLLHKYVNVEVDQLMKSERPEWSTARYHAYYSPYCAFELQVHWMIATGSILGELINNWARKAGACGFHVLPVPVDPFALPSAPDSDPLRGPIFVPLNVTAMEPSGNLFQGHDDDTKQQKLFLLQEAIIKRYGFMPTNVRMTDQLQQRVVLPPETEEHQQYVHCTGGMFVIIELYHMYNTTATPASQLARSPAPGLTTKCTSKEAMRGSGSLGKKSSAELRKDYIARQTSEILKVEKVDRDNKIGFLWSWNFMSSRRWRSANTGDEHFQDKVLADFRKFCSNDENRLCEFWAEYRENHPV